MTETARLQHLPPLADDYIHDYAKVHEFYGGDFRDPAAFERQAERVRSREIPREELAACLAEQNTGYGCGPETLDGIGKIVRDRAAAVVTGQQVGLFSGPLYTIYKALTAVKLANALGQKGLGSVVPVFWMASDDHDLAEIDHVTLMDKENRLREIRCGTPSAGSKIPVANVPLPQEIVDCLRLIGELTLDTEFKAEIVAALKEDYAPRRSYVEAFARWMTRLFKSSGLVFVDASHPLLKKMGKDVFLREIAGGSPSTREAVAASERLRQAGYAAQIPLHEGILNLFYVDPERRTIRCEGGTFEVQGMASPQTKETLLALAGEKPFLFSPNVLLRPLYQDALLPTLAYVGGPAEIAYFAQLKGAYEAFGLPMPVVFPRKGMTIVEKKIGHILKKYHLEVPDIWGRAGGLVGEIAEDKIPDAVGTGLRLVRENLERDFTSLKTEILTFEGGLADSVDLARGKMDRQLDFLERKLHQAATKRNEIAVRQLRKAIDDIVPNERLQERVFNIVPYLIKYGAGFIDRLGQAVDIGNTDHQFLFL